MPDSSSPAETADRLNRRRARILPVLAAFMLIQQATFFGASGGVRSVDMVRNSAWIVLAAVIVATLVTGGYWLQSREVRRLIDDEVTQANRSSALAWGFTVAMIAAIGLFALESFGPGQATTREAIHIIVTAGLATALLRFGYVERRALG